MITVAQFSDLHYCEKHLAWVDKAFTWAIDHAIASRAEVGVISGDSFDNTIAVHHPAVSALMRAVHHLAEHMPVLILQGTYSHDRPGSLDVFKTMRARYPIYVADEPALVMLTNRNGRMTWQPLMLSRIDTKAEAGEAYGLMDPVGVFACVPSINPAEARAEGYTSAEMVGGQLAHWRPAIDGARGVGAPTIMVSHGTVNGCSTESKMAMISPDHEFGTAQLFDSGCSAIMLGHIHAHQAWARDTCRAPQKPVRQLIAYPGSITKLIYGHAAKVGYLLWSVEAENATHVLHETPSRELVEIDYDGPPDMVDLRTRLADLRGCYVRLRWSVDEEHRQTVDQDAIRAALDDAGVAEFNLEGRVNPVQRVRTAGINKAASIEEKLVRWCEDTSTDPAPLLPRLALLRAGQQPGAASTGGTP